MTKTKTTKRALIASVLSLLVCFTMLIGSTFAWFTDSATTGVNTIQSGNLKIGMYYANGTTDPNSADWTNAEGASIFNYDLWEPGYTVANHIKISNEGNLALKYLLNFNIEGEIGKLAEVIDVYFVDPAVQVADRSTLASATPIGTLKEVLDGTISAPTGDLEATKSNIVTIALKMKESANNDYQNQSVGKLTIHLFATQDTVENDSFGNDYDKNVTIYPAGVTNESFADNMVAVTSDGIYIENTANGIKNAINAGGTLYFKEGATVASYAAHPDVTKDLTIYANGANFGGQDISIGTYTAPDKKETNVSIYNAQNLVVWGSPVGREDIWNVSFYDCVNEGYNFLMYRGDDAATSKINLTMENCTATGYSDSIIHTSADGMMKITNCTFNDNCAPVNIAHKQSGAMNITVEKCVFNNCGKIDSNNDYFAPARFVNNSSVGSLNVTLKNNTFTGTIGTNGDILLGDYREGKSSHALTAVITTENPVMVKSSSGAAESYNGGTITLSN